MTVQAFVPYLSVLDAKAAVAFYARVFDVAPMLVLTMPDGRVMYAEFQVGGARLFVSEELLEHGGTPSPASLGGTTVAIHLYSDDCDAMVDRMTEAGAQLLMAPTDTFWGERFARVRDPYGHEWGITTRLREMTADAIQTLAAEMFAQADTPDS